MNIKLIVDSSCDLPKEVSSKYNFSVIPLSIQIGEKTYKDRYEINCKEILEESEKEKVLPKTSAINPKDLTQYFTLELNNVDHLIFLPISSNISSIYNNTLMAVKTMKAEDKITVLDTKSLTAGTGLLALGILQDIENNESLENIIKNHNDRVKKVSVSFVIDTMEYLYKGGRCSGMAYIFANKFHLHPVIKVEDGKMSVHKITRGKDISKGLNVLIDEFKEDLEKNNVDFSYPVFIPNVESENGVKHIKSTLSKKIGETILFRVDASGIICCHCGRNTCGLVYMKKNA